MSDEMDIAQNGKGSKYRPVNPDVYGSNFDRIFRKKKTAKIPAKRKKTATSK